MYYKNYKTENLEPGDTADYSEIHRILETSVEQQKELLKKRIKEIEEELDKRDQINEQITTEKKQRLKKKEKELRQTSKTGSTPTQQQKYLHKELQHLHRQLDQEQRKNWKNRQELLKEKTEKEKQLKQLKNDQKTLKQLL